MQMTKESIINIPLVDLKAQYASIQQEIDSAIREVISHTAFVGGPHVKAFEEAFAEYCGAKHCIGVGNGTDALFLALRALGIGPGDEVITAANSFIATSEAITMAGAQVVFADIDPRTYNLDVSKLEEKITPRTRAIIPVHLYGQPADMDPIREIARRHGLRVIGDAAQAHGALYKGAKLPALADITCYSFYPGKNLGAYGDGGAIVTDNDEWAADLRMLANHGRSKKYDHQFEGVNSRLDGLQAAILKVKLAHLDAWTEMRRRNAALYHQALADRCVVRPQEIDDVRAVYHLYVVRVDRQTRPTLLSHLKSNGVGASIHYPIALPLLEAYRHLGLSESDYPEAYKASQEVVSLPMYPELTEEQIGYVAEKIADFGL